MKKLTLKSVDRNSDRRCHILLDHVPWLQDDAIIDDINRTTPV